MTMQDDLVTNYANAYSNDLDTGRKPALILIDFVQAYFEPSCVLYADVDAELASALRLRAAARANNIPVIYTNVIYNKGGVNGGIFYKKVEPLRHFQEGGTLGKWPQGLQPATNELVISKQYPSAFFGTSLASTLTAMGCDSLIITGLTTSGCIRASCIDCISYGFIPIVVADACGDRHDAPHQANLFDMKAKYASVMSEEKATQYIAAL